jgi:hypothetical protein
LAARPRARAKAYEAAGVDAIFLADGVTVEAVLH